VIFIKSLHFCTPLLLKKIKDPDILEFRSFRTGFIPNIYKGDVILKGNDTFLCNALVRNTGMWKYGSLHDYLIAWELEEYIEEIAKYKRNFNRDHIFVSLIFKKLKDLRKWV